MVVQKSGKIRDIVPLNTSTLRLGVFHTPRNNRAMLLSFQSNTNHASTRGLIVPSIHPKQPHCKGNGELH